MAITQAMTTSFKVEILSAYHNFNTTNPAKTVNTQDTFYMALYTSAATLDSTTGAYTASNESSGSGYTAGGQALTISNVPNSATGTTAWLSFSNITWTSATLSAAGAMIYNNSLAGKNSVAVLSFGGTITSTAGNFTVVMPTANNTSAIIRIA
jgi:hypothetical protein